MRALDLFCGAGGLSLGFSKSKFDVTGVDINNAAKETFELNSIGKFISADLSRDMVDGDYDIILGGPPCKPWATINTTRRGNKHPDYKLLSRFFDHVTVQKPRAFLMENVPTLQSQPILKKQLARVRSAGYAVATRAVKYSEFGAPTIRRRLIIFGLQNEEGDQNRQGDAAEDFFKRLFSRSTEATTVREAIWYLRRKEMHEEPDHEWPELKTIHKYRKFYATGKYGWYILKWNEPSHSFGNILKTYVLHPDSFNGGITRVISVREAWRLLGFNRGFRLPEELGMEMKYQLAVDAVSPRFSLKAAKTAKEILDNGDAGNDYN
jgi:DNA (cytosine-5)-methyltransferase 1